MAMDLQKLWLAERNTVLLITHSIAEAVLLADRVFVFAPRPGRVQMVVDVDLPRPRTLDVADSPEFGQYAHAIRVEFEAMGLY
jgi:NitT/TauT family transport system ATP-binding protein